MAILKRENIRITPQRQEMISILKNTKQHLTAEEIFTELGKQFSSVSITTVYNNLKLFVKLGFVKELQFGEGLSKFEWKDEEHYHIICSSCGKIEDFHYPRLKEVEAFAQDLSKFKIKNHQLQFYGICIDCKDEEK
ncbi:transcriptional repressor [Bacillus sp. V3B]|uniref:Fur family transcriptional regulator n=1 Tax=Bacillus sp. V3B TaxID=2804915 RepID=UPI00210EECAB|nr:Fur family transcriptional regulator [Bacillus sp. V3B]MCQ6274315.1 transcriptional repressor [Bacillus sp. V3B]